MVRGEDIRLKLSKCQFAKNSVVYLGYDYGYRSLETAMGSEGA